MKLWTCPTFFHMQIPILKQGYAKDEEKLRLFTCTGAKRLYETSVTKLLYL